MRNDHSTQVLMNQTTDLALDFYGKLGDLAAFVLLATNALLRGEQRNTDAAAYHLNHLNQRKVKMPRVANPS
ncbi:hypothetical protein [Vibrio alginolyticus]|uniref:hypothetical protein n=1 Tax=Vibrio alginolyticus TaxID=663 RepID=UPI002FF18212